MQEKKKKNWKAASGCYLYFTHTYYAYLIGKKERGDRYQVKLNFWNPTLTFDRHLTPVWTSRLAWIWTLRKNDDADQGWARRTGSITFIGLGSDDTFHLFLTNILYQTNLHHIPPPPPFSPHNVEKFFYHMQLLKTVFPLPSIEMKLSSFSFSRNKNEKKVMNLIGSSMYLVFSSIKW